LKLDKCTQLLTLLLGEVTDFKRKEEELVHIAAEALLHFIKDLSQPILTSAVTEKLIDAASNQIIASHSTHF
jgi:hypothetical protein